MWLFSVVSRMEKTVKMNLTFLWFPWNAEVADLVSHFRRSLELE